MSKNLTNFLPIVVIAAIAAIAQNLSLFILLLAIFLGVRLGGLAIGYAGGAGVLAMSAICGIAPGNIPIDVILIISCVIAAISAMQQAGGLDYLVRLAERALRRCPRAINVLAPTITYLLTLFAGTGHTAFSMMPVIIEVAKEQRMKPSLPLALAVVASQIGITASPVSAAVIYLSGVLEPFGYSYLGLLGVWIASTYAAILLVSLLLGALLTRPLDDAPAAASTPATPTASAPASAQTALPKGAALSVGIFLLGVLAIIAYACAISGKTVTLGRDAAIMTIMLSVAVLITAACRLDTDAIARTSVFRSGMSACVCVLGVAWLGDTFVAAHLDLIKRFATELVAERPYLLAVAFFFASMLLYSQAATAKALVPAVIAALGVAAEPEQARTIIASFAAVSALFVLPTYPTLLGAVAMDDTGSTKIGRFIFNHSFFVPGVAMIAASVAFGFVLVRFL